MKKYCFRGSIVPKGFTLIELLVVVLIVAVLAAIALPQYQRAVLKAKFKRYSAVAHALVEAEEAYHLEHGKYTKDAAELNITLPSPCKLKFEENNANTYQCDKDWIQLNIEYEAVLVEFYCSAHRKLCVGQSYPLYFHHNKVFGEKSMCMVLVPGGITEAAKAYARRVCKTVGATIPATGTAYEGWYWP